MTMGVAPWSTIFGKGLGMGFNVLYKQFISCESGAVTLDWVVLTAGLVGLGIAVASAVTPGTTNAVESIEMALIRASLEDADRTTVNGGFDSWVSGWTGNDVEIGRESTYHPGASSDNFIIELDGYNNRADTTSVIQQTFSVSGESRDTITFSAALRFASQAGSEGFRAEVVSETGDVLASKDIMPETTDWTDHTMNVIYPDAGDYTVRFTELGTDNGSGALLDNFR